MGIRSILEPLLILGNREKVNFLIALRDSNDRSDELHQELRNLQQGGVKMVEIVQDKTFNVRTIVILNEQPNQLVEINVTVEHKPDQSLSSSGRTVSSRHPCTPCYAAVR